MTTNQTQTRTRLEGMIAAESTRPMSMRITMHGAKFLIDNKLGNQPDWIAQNRVVRNAQNQALKTYFAARVTLTPEETAPQEVIDAIAEIDEVMALQSVSHRSAYVGIVDEALATPGRHDFSAYVGITFMGTTYPTEADAADAVAYDYITGAGTWTAEQVSQIIRGSEDGVEVRNGSATTAAIFAVEAESFWNIPDISTEALTEAMQRFIDTRPDMEAAQ